MNKAGIISSAAMQLMVRLDGLRINALPSEFQSMWGKLIVPQMARLRNAIEAEGDSDTARIAQLEGQLASAKAVSAALVHAVGGRVEVKPSTLNILPMLVVDFHQDDETGSHVFTTRQLEDG